MENELQDLRQAQANFDAAIIERVKNIIINNDAEGAKNLLGVIMSVDGGHTYYYFIKALAESYEEQA